MSNTNNTTKKRKSEAMERKVTLASELQDLLTPLRGGAPLDLSLVASFHVSDTARFDERQRTAMNYTAADHLTLFEQHIGPYHDVLGNAAKHAKNLWEDEYYCYHMICEPVNEERYIYPRLGGRVVKGPRPDPCVWVGLFLGRDYEERMRAELKQADEIGSIDEYEALKRAIVDRSKHCLSVLELTRNVLRYLRQESARLPDATNMLRFCALYGLSGAIDDILSGKYGHVDTLTIDSLLPFKEHDAKTGDFSFLMFDEMFMPAWAFGSALGYRNVVRHCIRALGAKTDMHLACRMKKSGERKERDSLPGLMLHWAISRNQPEMLKCLVSECGFHFRWIADNLEEIFQLVFHVNHSSDEYGVWRSRKYTEEHWGDSRFRARCCYKEKQKMLQIIIELGMPFELFIPQLNVEFEKKALKDATDRGLDEADEAMLKDYVESLTRLERKAQRPLYDAANEFLILQKRGTSLSLVEFYEKIVDMWKDQPTVQKSRLSDFEKLDPRWAKYEEKGEEAFAPWWGRKSDYDSDDEE